VNWKGGMISEVHNAGPGPRTIDLDWQILLMEAVRKIDETSASADASAADSGGGTAPVRRKVLVIDDSAMLLNFVREVLSDANYDVTAAATANEGLRAASSDTPDLILLDYVLPDMKGDEVLSRLSGDAATANVRVVYMSGFGTELPADPNRGPNVVGSLSKPFTSELLLSTVETYMPNADAEANANAPADDTFTAPEVAAETEGGWAPADNPDAESGSFPDAPAYEPVHEDGGAGGETAFQQSETATAEVAAGGSNDAWWNAPAPAPAPWPEMQPAADPFAAAPSPTRSRPRQVADAFTPAPQEQEQFAPVPAGMSTSTPSSSSADDIDFPIDMSGAYFCGDTSFFSLNWALHTIANQQLTGTLRCFWNREPVEVLARNGQIILATTRDAELYCAEAPITLVNIDEQRVADARNQQRENGRPCSSRSRRKASSFASPPSSWCSTTGRSSSRNSGPRRACASCSTRAIIYRATSMRCPAKRRRSLGARHVALHPIYRTRHAGRLRSRVHSSLHA
jgi:CheY-like chemotaxis protein